MLLLSSCTRAPAPTPEQVISLPPETVFTPCDQPTLQGDTWGDAVSYTLSLQTSLQICAGQVGVLNQWRRSLKVE
ncbi:Rz1-like lysis system protein LysC [Serratia liquefaciens]